MKIFRICEKIYIVTSLLFFSGGLLQRAIAEDDHVARWTPDTGYRIGQFIIYVLLLPLLAVHWRKILRAVRYSGWIVALCFLAGLSASWSSDIRFTGLSAISLTALTLFAIYFASCFSWDEQLSMFAWLSVIVVLGSCFMAIFIPSYGISQDIHWGAVKGLFPNKNIMGRQMVFAILTLALAEPIAMPTWIRRSCLATAVVLLLLANAATSLVTAIFCALMFPVLYLLRVSKRRTLPLWVPIAPIVVLSLIGAIANYGALAHALGRNATLTGRVPLWNAVIGAIGHRPLLGYGYNIFWKRDSGELAKVIYAARFAAVHAHDGYLDILLAMGALGLLVFFGGYLTNLFRAIRVFQLGEIRGAKWPLFFLLFFAVFNLTESAILRPMSFLWIPFVSTFVSLALMRVSATAEDPHYARSVVARAALEGGNHGGVDGIVPGYGV